MSTTNENFASVFHGSFTVRVFFWYLRRRNKLSKVKRGAFTQKKTELGNFEKFFARNEIPIEFFFAVDVSGKPNIGTKTSE